MKTKWIIISSIVLCFVCVFCLQIGSSFAGDANSLTATIGYASGVLLVLSAFAFGVKILSTKHNAQATADDEFDLDLRFTDQNDTPPDKKGRTTYGCSRSCVGDTCATCGDTCANTCGCPDHATKRSDCCDVPSHIAGCGQTLAKTCDTNCC